MMQAGRELDAKVAEALGWEVKGESVYKDGEWYDWLDDLKFSTSWNGMGELVEEARKQGYGFRFSLHGNNDTVMVGTELDGSFKFEAFSAGETAPLTACLAYLKAKGIAI